MKNFFVNSISGILQIFVTLILSIIAIPLLIQKLGLEFYGSLSLLLLIGNLNIFVNFGFNASLIKFLARQGKTRESNIDVITASITLMTIIIILTILAAVFYDFIIFGIFNIPAKFHNEDMVILYRLLLFSNMLLFLNQVPSAVIDSLQKIYFSNTFQTLYSILNWTFIILAVSLSTNIIFIGLAYAVSSFILLFVCLFTALKLWGNVLTNISYAEFRRSLNKQFSYGIKIYSSGVMAYFYEPLTKILVSHYLGINEVGFYDIALRIKNQIINIFSKIYYPLFPYLSQLQNIEKIKNIIYDLEQKAYYLTLSFIPLLFFIIPAVIEIWLGRDVEVISMGIIVLTTSYLLFSVNITPLYLFLLTHNHAGDTIVVQGINVIVNIAAFFVLEYYNFANIAVFSNAFAIFVSFQVCLYYQKKYLDSRIFENYTQTLKAALIFIGVLFPMCFLNMVISENLMKIYIFSPVWVLLSIFLYRYLNIFSNDDISKYIPNERIGNFIRFILVRDADGK